MTLSVRALLLGLAVVIAVPTHATESIDHAQAASIFRQARVICTRDGGALWGHTLCGPMLLVNPDDRSVVTNQPDAAGTLQRSGSVYIGSLPASEPLADTTLTWSGTRWCELMWPWPMREDPEMRHVTLAHELFHRIQTDDLHIERSDGDNSQLDTLDGRYLIQLEWRALAAALQASTSADRKTAVADAILFRRERYRLFPSAAANEMLLESNEGIAEYTGVRLGLQTPAERTRYALRDLSTWAQVPSFVRSFAYATGPAYGLLLDETDPGWLRSFVATQHSERFDQRLAVALNLPEPDLTQVHTRAAVYDPDDSLHASEVARDQQNRAQLAEFKTKLIDGPVLTLPLVHAQFEFKPQSLVTIEDIGTVYPTITLRDDWGTLKVESGGALVRANNQKKPRFPLPGLTPHATHIDKEGSWTPRLSLTLKPGWTIRPGARKGDLVVSQTAKTQP